MYTCRECENLINQATEICPFCGADLTLPAPSQQEQPTKKRSTVSGLLRWGVLLGGLFAVLWGFLWYVLPERSGNPALRAEAHAAEALQEARTAIVSYAGATGGSYPPTLESAGDPARRAARKAMSEGYQLQYTPGQAGDDGRVRNFVLLARPGNYGYRSFFVDESGVLRATRENRPAGAQDPPY